MLEKREPSTPDIKEAFWKTAEGNRCDDTSEHRVCTEVILSNSRSQNVDTPNTTFTLKINSLVIDFVICYERSFKKQEL